MNKNGMNKKEIESPKLTANFLVWIGLFVLLMVLVAHYIFKFF
jgi:preprotein translocase subunit Sec61beta